MFVIAVPLAICLSAIGFDSVGSTTSYVRVAHAEEEATSTPVMIEVAINWTPERIHKEVVKDAEAYGSSVKKMEAIIHCESQGSTTIQSLHYDGKKRENSWGLVQIFLDAHKDITKEQALNPEFAIDYLAKNLAHHTDKWSCEKLI